MKLLAALLSATLVPAAMAAPGAESLKASGEAAFLAVPKFAPPKLRRAPQELPPELKFDEPIVNDPNLHPQDPAGALGATVGRFALAGQLDRHRDVLKKQLGGSNWDIGVAGDAAYKTWFLTFRQNQKLIIAPLGDLNRLRGDGIDVTIEPGLVYNFHVSINIFNPVRGSTLEITPTQGTQGPGYDDIKTGVILDSIKAHSYVFKADGVEYWTLYGTDVDPATNKLADTRSFAFIHLNGMNSKVWPVGEGSLPLNASTAATFGDNKYVLTRTAAELVIQKP